MLHPAKLARPEDVIIGTADADTLQAAAGGSRILGEGGDDVLRGAAGDDVLVGGDGKDTFVDQMGGDNLIRGGAGDDYVFPGAFGGPEHTTVLGGAGFDQVDFFLVGQGDGATVGLTLDLRVETVQDAGSAGTIVLNSVEGLNGSLLSDRLTGTADDNVLGGMGGDDTLRGLGGDDRISGGNYMSPLGVEHDLLLGGAGADTLNAGPGFDNYMFSTLLGGAGDDSLQGGLWLDGGRGNDDLFTRKDDATLIGGDGDDTLLADGVAGRLSGGGGNDSLQVEWDHTTVSGGAGDDIISFNPFHLGLSNGSVDGGDGADTLTATVYLDSASPLHINLDAEAAGHKLLDGGGGFVRRVETGALSFGGQDDWVRLGATHFQIAAGAGNDTVIGGAGNDVLDGGTGIDRVFGGIGDDDVTGGSGDTLTGGDGRDVLHLHLTGVVGVTANLNNLDTGLWLEDGTRVRGFETGDFAFADGNDWVSWTLGAFSVTAGGGDDDVIAGSRNDTVQGGDGADQLSGGSGNDLLYDGAPGDFGSDDSTDGLFGGLGADTLQGGAGDTLNGGQGTDTVRLTEAFSDAGATVDLTPEITAGRWRVVEVGTAKLVDVERGDLYLSGTDLHVQAGDPGLAVHGGIENDTFTASAAGNVLDGGAGLDLLTGGAGADRLTGGDDNDTLVGGGGADVLSGGQGQDTYVFAASDSTATVTDLITDLQAEDTLNLSRLSTAAGATVHLVSAFGGAAGEMTLTYEAATDLTTLAIDLDGDRTADFLLTATGDQHVFTNFAV